ncbi:MAG TPA: DUF2304 domain-containing protein [Acidobacteriota bacterium]|nr:DUF2304 domain-containing protein [Acidobacteriota bacterium]
MPLTQKIFAISMAVLFFIIVIDLARRKKLKVEYSILWIVTSSAILGLVVWYEPLVSLTKLIGAVLPTTTLFILGMMFLLFLNLHFSVKNSELSEQVKNLGHELGMHTMKEAEQEKKSGAPL